MLYKNLIIFRNSLAKLPETQAFNLRSGDGLRKKQRQNYIFFPNPQTLVLKKCKIICQFDFAKWSFAIILYKIWGKTSLRIRLERSFWSRNFKIEPIILLIIKIMYVAPSPIVPARYNAYRLSVSDRHIIFLARHLFFRIMLINFLTILRHHSLGKTVANYIARLRCMPYTLSARFIPALPLC